MTIDDIIALSKAGYTKNDIKELITAGNTSPADNAKQDPEATSTIPSNNSPKQNDNPAPDPAGLDISKLSEQINSAISEGLANITKTLAVVSPSIDVTPVDINDVITNFFKED